MENEEQGSFKVRSAILIKQISGDSEDSLCQCSAKSSTRSPDFFLARFKAYPAISTFLELAQHTLEPTTKTQTSHGDLQADQCVKETLELI